MLITGEPPSGMISHRGSSKNQIITHHLKALSFIPGIEMTLTLFDNLAYPTFGFPFPGAAFFQMVKE
jgi:hypothetical protein